MQNFLAFLLRAYSFVFHLTLGVFLAGSAAIAYRTGQRINLDMLPFPDEGMRRATLLLGLAAIFCTLLALTRGFKVVFFLWTLLVFYLMLKWFYFSGYVFDSAQQAKGAGWLTFGSSGAFMGAWWALKTRKRSAVI